MRSPGFTNSGTWTTAPVSSFAGFVTFETVSPFTPGSVSVTVSSTDAGSRTPEGRPFTTSICTELDGCMNSSASSTDPRGNDVCSYVFSSMNTTSSPASYRYCMFFVSVRIRGNFSPARNVRSTTAPESSAFSFVRTNAPPLPGFTCWNSTIRQTPPSSSMCIPFLNWFVLTCSATAQKLTEVDHVFAEVREVLDAVRRHDDVVLDTDAADAFEVDARLDGDDVGRRERVLRFRRHPGRLVHLEPEAVTETVAECAFEVGCVDDRARDAVGLDTAQAAANPLQRSLLRFDDDGVGVVQAVRERTGGVRARVVGRVAVDRTAGVDDDRLAAADLASRRARSPSKSRFVSSNSTSRSSRAALAYRKSEKSRVFSASTSTTAFELWKPVR